MYRPCHDDVDVMISFLFTMAIRVSLFEHSITYVLQRLGYKTMTLKPQQRMSVKYVYEE